MSGKVEYASDIYPLWLRAADLEGRAVTVKIARVDVETFHGRDGGDRQALVLSFERARRRLILNRTQVNALCRILRSERLADWVGKRITLAPGVAPNGKPTIVIREAAPENNPLSDRDQGNG